MTNFQRHRPQADAAWAYDLNGVQEAIAKALAPLGTEITQGRLIKDAALTSGQDTPVQHLLGRIPQGWLVVRRVANVTVWENVTGNPLPSKQLLLQPSTTTTVDLWVF